MAARGGKKPAGRGGAGGGGGRFAGAGRWALMVGLVVGGVAGGYAWRSYAPLPIFEGTPLAGDGEKATVSGKDIKRVEKKLDEIDAMRQKTAEDLADLQIKTIIEEK